MKIDLIDKTRQVPQREERIKRLLGQQASPPNIQPFRHEPVGKEIHRAKV